MRLLMVVEEIIEKVINIPLKKKRHEPVFKVYQPKLDRKFRKASVSPLEQALTDKENNLKEYLDTQERRRKHYEEALQKINAGRI